MPPSPASKWKTRSAQAVTDQRYYNFRGIPSVCFGACGDLAHGADEWLDLTSLPIVAKVMGSFILDWCGVEG